MSEQKELSSPAMRKSADPAIMIIFGASGDLTRRKLVPSLYSLTLGKLMPEQFHVLGVARSQLTDEQFAESLKEGMAQFGRHKPRDLWPSFSKRLSYLSGGYDDPETYRRLAEKLDQIDTEMGLTCNRLFYLAIPPTLYGEVIERLGEVGLNHTDGGWSRIIIEKPFGRDLKSAHELNELTHKHFAESQVYRIDHYLGKETVQNILTFRFANSIFEPLWNRNYVDNVQISVLESVGVGHRGGYYDQSGVLRDMFQNHLLQLLSLVAMEAPASFDADALRNEKVKALSAVRLLSPEEVLDHLVVGQYEGYLDIPEVEDGSRTPTYAALSLYLDNWRWQGVPFYLRSGKGLKEKMTEIVIGFKSPPHVMFPLQVGEQIHPNVISMCIQPDEGIHLRFEAKVPDTQADMRSVDMDFHYKESFGEVMIPEAYERLLMNAINGDAALFTRADGIEAAWRIVDPLLQVCESGRIPTAKYKKGSWGPVEADELMAREGRAWQFGCMHS